MPITLDDINAENGCLQYLFLAETAMPSAAGYNEPDAERCFNAIKATVYNRINHYQYFPPRPSTAMDVVTQDGQYPEFGKDVNGNVTISDASNAIIQDALSIANNDNDQRSATYAQHIQAAIRISQTPAGINDEFANVTSVNGVATLGGSYGFNNSGYSLGGRFVFIPNGIILKTHFATMVKDQGFFAWFRRLFR